MRQQFASAKLNSTGMRSINGHDFLVIDVDVPLPDGTNHNHMAITSFEGRMLIISYNCMPSRNATARARQSRDRIDPADRQAGRLSPARLQRLAARSSKAPSLRALPFSSASTRCTPG